LKKGFMEIELNIPRCLGNKIAMGKSYGQGKL
jgi:hypothetical protein